MLSSAGRLPHKPRHRSASGPLLPRAPTLSLGFVAGRRPTPGRGQQRGDDVDALVVRASTSPARSNNSTSVPRPRIAPRAPAIGCREDRGLIRAHQRDRRRFLRRERDAVPNPSEHCHPLATLLRRAFFLSTGKTRGPTSATAMGPPRPTTTTKPARRERRSASRGESLALDLLAPVARREPAQRLKTARHRGPARHTATPRSGTSTPRLTEAAYRRCYATLLASGQGPDGKQWLVLDDKFSSSPSRSLCATCSSGNAGDGDHCRGRRPANLLQQVLRRNVTECSTCSIPTTSCCSTTRRPPAWSTACAPRRYPVVWRCPRTGTQHTATTKYDACLQHSSSPASTRDALVFFSRRCVPEWVAPDRLVGDPAMGQPVSPRPRTRIRRTVRPRAGEGDRDSGAQAHPD